MIPISVLMLISFLTSPVWVIVWIVTGWWIYPWGNTILRNISSWVMVRSTAKDLVTGEYYQKSDYQTLKQ